jgi:hypothetical protein
MDQAFLVFRVIEKQVVPNPFYIYPPYSPRLTYPYALLLSGLIRMAKALMELIKAVRVLGKNKVSTS